MESARLSDISETFESMWIEYVLTSPLIDTNELRVLAGQFDVPLRGALAKTPAMMTQALLSSVGTKRLLPRVRDLVERSVPTLLTFREAKKAYSSFPSSNIQEIASLISLISTNKALKREIDKATTQRDGALRFAPPGLLRRVALAELYTVTREEALSRLKKAGIAIG